MKHLLSCEFNLDTACVELCFSDGSMVSIDTKLNDDRFAMMSKTYEDEQAQLKVEIVNLQKEIEVQERWIEDLEQFIQRARRQMHRPHRTYAIRSQRACKGALCGGIG